MIRLDANEQVKYIYNANFHTLAILAGRLPLHNWNAFRFQEVKHR